ncbi:hypothetical protein AeNC1_014952, partial [Aphanomyces euteiches]
GVFGCVLRDFVKYSILIGCELGKSIPAHLTTNCLCETQVKSAVFQYGLKVAFVLIVP